MPRIGTSGDFPSQSNVKESLAESTVPEWWAGGVPKVGTSLWSTYCPRAPTGAFNDGHRRLG